MLLLLSLPFEILALIPHHLANIEDFKELSSTCRRLRAACSSAPPNLILRLAAASSPVFFRPHPYFLVAATARQVGDWALLNEDNAARLRASLKHGIQGLFHLCVEKAGLTMEDIRWLHASRFTTFNPVTDLIDRCAGKQWYDIPQFWYGARSDAETILCEPERATFELAAYGALFHSSLEAALAGQKGLSLETRLDFVRYCIPDRYCADYPGFHVEATGPYRDRADPDVPQMDQYSIMHILKSSTWRRAWAEAKRVGGGLHCEDGGFHFGEESRQRIWDCAVQVMQGLEGYDMIRPGGVERWRSRLLALKEKVERMDDARIKAADTDMHGTIDWLECPILKDEIFCCYRGMFPVSFLLTSALQLIEVRFH
ncbi:MAG: hypothetical protein LQ344_004945 [Seirophora lacunosa]|nr:MAG: hypothetical protein LQ344_004945 [Seirophora lacunosa]